MAALRIVLYSILAAIGYGTCQDLVTAHIFVEYFTVAHPLIFPSDSPVVMALIWGVLATWWLSPREQGASPTRWERAGNGA